MKGELIINNVDAYEAWGVSMGKGFLDAIDSFVPMKDYVTNKSRLMHGEMVLLGTPKVDSREVTLSFTISGTSENDYRIKRNMFELELQKGLIAINVPSLGYEVYKLIYLGKSPSYNMNLARTFSEVSIRFKEPNPIDRSEGKEEK